MMSKQKKSAYNFAYKVGITVFVILVGIVSLIVISLTKSCNTFTKTNIQHHDSLITMMDTVYLPNPNAVKVVVHDTVYKTATCNKKHCDVVKTTKDTSKSK
jgi:hypothetical protein